MIRRAPSLAVLCLIPLLICGRANGDETALDRYVAAPDDSYHWELVRTVPGPGYTTYVLDLTSQTWRSEDDVDRTQWRHWLSIVKPDNLRFGTALLVIGGGRNGREAPQDANGMVRLLALSTNSVVAELGQVPNQPLVFHGDGVGRTEDDLIAYTWDQYLKTSDDQWPARLPMVKSAVRAMDAIQEFLASEAGGGEEIDGFVVAGGSKRGWTTWMTAAVDKRVKAIVPIVIDVLNTRPQMRHHFAAYGFWAPSLNDYVHHKIPQRENTPEYAALLKIEDPYEYRDRFTLPKFVLNSAGDQFFLPDSSQFYFNDLPGEKLLRYVPNTNHSLDGSDAIQSLQAFYSSILTDTPRPQFTWEYPGNGSILVKPQTAPKQVRLWRATNPDARDFRLETLGAKYEDVELDSRADGTFLAEVPEPAKGWTAYFVELTFDSGGLSPFKFTTPVRVTPDILPFANQVPMTAGN